MAEPFIPKRYYGLACDPVHVGTGGYRLGRVDNTIMREPGTNLPKIPGSSIAGVTRAFTAMAIQCGADNTKLFSKEGEVLKINQKEYEKMKYLRPCFEVIEGKVKTEDGEPVIKRDQGNEIYLSCAGKGGGEGDGHCGEPGCPVCISFGFSKKGNSFQGMAQFTDARILFSPVHSMIGPVWVTCPSVLKELGEDHSITGDAFRPIGIDGISGDNLNFGWLMLPKSTEGTIILALATRVGISDFVARMTGKMFLVPDRLFSRIVNDNLEVRTSVAINPMTGAAEEGALYTYEAIPRATVLWFDVVYNKPEFFRVRKGDRMVPIVHDSQDGEPVEWVRKNVEKGFPYIETLGLGGMNTRGMGRVRIVPLGVAT